MLTMARWTRTRSSDLRESSSPSSEYPTTAKQVLGAERLDGIEIEAKSSGESLCEQHVTKAFSILAVDQNQWYHFGAPPIFSLF